jgi:hypothetical protein
MREKNPESDEIKVPEQVREETPEFDEVKDPELAR